ncbi:MAG: DNA-3-methyladenine glycosylase [Phycisphaerales bacterium]
MPVPSPMPRPSRDFYDVDAQTLAERLIGMVLVRATTHGSRLAGRIVETEAYLGPIDRACHTFGGRRTERNETMWGPVGHAYVYLTYGMHHMLNVVCVEPREGQGGAAVLIRALEPIEGTSLMAEHRGLSAPRSLCSGPGKLCQALRIDRALDSTDLVTSDVLWLELGDRPADWRVIRCSRIGVDNAGAWATRRLRWLVRAHQHVSVRAKCERTKSTSTRPQRHRA